MILALVEAPCAFSATRVLGAAVKCLQRAKGRVKWARSYVKTNTCQQGVILTTVTYETHFFEFSCTTMGRQALFERGTY